jgi:hypothetical protein
VIWSANLPEEITWYLHRQRSGWFWVATVLISFQFALPFLVLLGRRNKQRLDWPVCRSPASGAPLRRSHLVGAGRRSIRRRFICTGWMGSRRLRWVLWLVAFFSAIAVSPPLEPIRWRNTHDSSGGL